ncbi:MFS transporter [Halobacillus amylolyticus]|uniref:MFS transporter n=1 Tax=Halobacillus amylolyticus TaxID=2932259 RepID=A0ABY4HDU2_9BACI|nr:MFS transporter [Halobacillus amylolyticus]
MEGCSLGTFAALLIVILAVLFDFFWLDVDRKRWGWMKNWTKFQKGLFFSGFAVVSVLIYVGLSLEFL